MPSKLRIIKKPNELNKLIRYCKQTGYASVDFETNAQPIYSDVFVPTILGVSFQPGSAWVLPLGHFDSKFKKSWKRLLIKFGNEVIANPNIIKIAHNLKFEYNIFKKYGITMQGRLFDTMLAKYLLNEERPHDLKSIVAEFIPEYANYEDDYEGSKLPWDKKPLKGLSKYCGLDCDLTFRLMVFFEDRLIKNKFYSFFRNMLMMGSRVLADSEYQGIYIETDYLEKLIVKYQLYLDKLDNDLHNHKKVKKFEKALIDSRVAELISQVSEEINDLDDEVTQLKKSIKGDPTDNKLVTALNRKLKAIQSREEKIDRYIVRDMNTKKELAVLEPFNFASPKQLIELLFTSKYGFKYDIVKYTIDKKTKRETQTPSTDEDVLTTLKKKHDSKLIDNLLEYRGTSKLFSTYIVGIKEKLIENKVHGRFNLHGTVTGRLSSSDPNLQNIPRDTTAADIKPMYVPPPGHLLLQLDYSQAELRVMAAMAGETTMIRWFKEGKDIHLTVALKKDNCEERYDEIAEVLRLEDDNDPRFKEWKVKRKYAKTINFGIIYGQGPPKLAESLECSLEEAKNFLREYFKLFPKIAKFIKKQHRAAHSKAYIKNVFGRKRRLWKIDSPNKWEVAEAERQSVNAPIQGAASDYTLFSSILIWEESLIKGNIPIFKPQCYTVHDSLGYYVLPEHVHEVVPKLEAICANPQTKEWFGFQIDDVTMQVDFEVSHLSWGNLKTYDPNFDYTTLF